MFILRNSCRGLMKIIMSRASRLLRRNGERITISQAFSAMSFACRDLVTDMLEVSVVCEVNCLLVAK